MCLKSGLQVLFPVNFEVFWGCFFRVIWEYLGAFQYIWGVSEKWSESAFSCEFAPFVYLKDDNQKISHSRLFPPTHYITSGGQQKGQLEESENSQQTLCMPLDYLYSTHAGAQMASLET